MNIGARRTFRGAGGGPAAAGARLDIPPPDWMDDRYELGPEIGRGGMGIVYEALHVPLGRPIALKVLGPEWVGDLAAMQRFTREARTIASIDHPHVVRVYDTGCLPSGRPWIAMERLAGEDLDDLLAREGPLSPRRVAAIVSAAAAALDVVHRRGIVHRDVKPANLFLASIDGETQLKILDFGLAALGHGRDRLTRYGMFIGTPWYMAPEATEATGLDHRADIYALGMAALELLTGRLPYPDAAPLEVLMLKRDREVPSMSELAGAPAPAALEGVVARAVCRDRSQRYESAGAFADALVHASEEAQRGSRPIVVPPRAPSMVPEPHANEPSCPPASGRWRLVTHVACLGAVAVASALGAFSLGSSRGAHDATVAARAAVLPVERDPAESAAHPEPTSAPSPALPAGREAPEVSEQDARAAQTEPGQRQAPIPEPVASAARPAPVRELGERGRVPGRGAAGSRHGSEGEPSSSTPDARPLAEPAHGTVELTSAGTRALFDGWLVEAARLYRLALAADGQHAPAWRGLGLAAERLGRRDEAARAYRRYLRLTSDGPTAAEVRRRIERLSPSPAAADR